MTTLKTTAEQPAMSEVKRWNVTNENSLWAAGDGQFVLASDFDALATVLTRIMSKMHNATYGGPGPANRPITHYVGRISVDDYDKAIALLGGEKGVGT